MTDDGGLFDAPEATPPTTRGGRRQALVQARIAHGRHPLNPSLPLHPTPGLTCGGCDHLVRQHYHDGRYLKCGFGGGVRVTRSDTSDVRRWWPACHDYTPRADG